MRSRHLVPVVTVSLLALVASTIQPAQANTSVTIVAVGDIAKSRGGQAKTAALTKNLNPTHIILLGDLVYPNGTDREFRRHFLPRWGSLLSKSWAIPGNHEYRTQNAAGYRNLVAKNGMPSTGENLWWVKQTGAWTVIGLDSETLTGETGQKQIEFLQQTLASNDGRPTLVNWHRPTFSRGHHGDQIDTAPLWDLVSKDKDVKLVLWAHEHNYEQLERVAQPGTADERKINTFIVGTGGATLRNCPTKNIPGELICGKKNNYGVLQLKLEDSGYSWSYRNANGKKLGRQLDSGRVAF